jgi:hypothetical protein
MNRLCADSANTEKRMRTLGLPDVSAAGIPVIAVTDNRHALA